MRKPKNMSDSVTRSNRFQTKWDQNIQKRNICTVA